MTKAWLRGTAILPLLGLSWGLSACTSTPASGPDGSVVLDSSATPDATADVTPEAAAPVGQPPARPSAPTAPTASSAAFVIQHVYLGDTNRDGTSNRTSGWMNYGYNLDQVVTTADSAPRCRTPPNGRLELDAPNGVDNSFGHNILPIITGLYSDASTQLNSGIAAGGPTLLFSIDGLGATADNGPLVTRIYTAEKLLDGSGNPVTPSFDGTDTRSVDPASLATATDLHTALSADTNSYLAANTLVANLSGTLEVPFTTGGAQAFSLPVPISRTILTAQLDTARANTMQGTLAGVISVAELNAEFARLAGAFDPSLCSGPTIDSIRTQIAAAADTLLDGTVDPSRQCDGITVGLGFDAVRVNLGPIGPPVAAPPDPCTTH